MKHDAHVVMLMIVATIIMTHQRLGNLGVELARSDRRSGAHTDDWELENKVVKSSRGYLTDNVTRRYDDDDGEDEMMN